MNPAGPVKLLLVDDEARNLDALEAILGGPEYELLRASDADLALRLLLDHDVAAIVLDIKMPGVSGFELAQLIKGTKRFRQIPILFLTAYMMEDQDMIAGYGAGAVDYLTKPINPLILRHKVAVFADLFRKTRALTEMTETLEQRVQERTAELERSEGALRLAARQKDEFLAILAHELRNPLAPLRTGLDLLLGMEPVAPKIDRTLASMNRQLDHMVRLIDDLLDVSRISTGKLDLKKERVDLAQVIERAIDGARTFFERRHQTITVDAPEPVPVVVDAVRIVQILGNLLHNASKFTPDGGHVRIELSQHEGRAMIRVVDSGVGIPPEQVDKVFQMFAHVDRPMTAVADRGLGIGLALARNLAEMHGGTLVALSAGENHGTTFTLTLPMVEQAPAAAGAAAVPKKTSNRPLRIVVIEDNDDVADTMGDWLGLQGHDASIARNGGQGVDLVHKVAPDVVLCDLGLPDMDGLEVCRRIRALPLDPQPFVIAATGWGREDDLRKTKDAGFDHHLVKPVKPDQLRVLLREYASRVAERAPG